MKNTTVKELIEILKTMNQEAIVCNFEFEDNEPTFSSSEIVKEFKNVTYIDDDGDDVQGDVVAIY